MPNGIPNDPRKRTKNHARLDITFWFDIPDEILKKHEVLDVTDMLRKTCEAAGLNNPEILKEFQENMAKIVGYNALVDLTHRVAK